PAWSSMAATRTSPSTSGTRGVRAPVEQIASSIDRATPAAPEECAMADTFFHEVPGRIPFGGPGAAEPLAYTVYEPDRMVLGKRMEDHLRIGVCLWHSFAWPGSDMFGMGTLDRPWLAPGLDPLEAARMKIESAFEFLEKLGVPFFCFHDRDVAPEQGSWGDTIALF